MAQEITTISDPAFVTAKVRGFFFTDNDGSQRIAVDSLQAWLVEQFSYLTAGGASPTAKNSQAGQIAAALEAVVGREHWQTNPNYPQAPAGGNAASVQDQLNLLRAQMNTTVVSMTDAYRPFDATLSSRIKALFNTMVLPSFPAGVEVDEVTRGYIETFVTDWGEESAPSPLSALVTLDQNDNATVNCSAAPAGRHITRRRLYRSATGNAQSAFKLQGEYDISQLQIIDTKLDAELNDVCATFGWIEPPAQLQGLTGMANGIMLGFVGRTIYACDPYAPYAWPAKYDKPLPHEIVGMVSLGQSVLVGTIEYPYLVSGADSASLTEERLPDLVPCASARSMVAVAGSVFYASPDGLALYENGRVTVVSDGIDRATWQSYGPGSMRAAGFDNRYVVFYTKADGTRGGLVFDYKTRTISQISQGADATLAAQDGLFILNGAGLFNLLPANGVPRVGRFDTKTFRLARPQAMFWIHVDSLFNAGPVTLRIYGDKDDGKGMRLVKNVTTSSSQPFRNAPGMYRDWRIEIESSSIINGITLATTTDELKAAQ